MKKSFVLFTDIWPMMQKLNMEQRGELFTAIMQYVTGEDPGALDELTDMAFGFIKAQLDRSAEKYQDICAKRAEYGRKGGLAKANKSKQKLANVAKSESDSKSDSDSKSKSKRDSDSDAAALPSLSLAEENEIYQEYGARTDELIADVSNWYTTHPERVFPGWSEAVAQFDRNQKRWGRTTPTSMEDILKKAFPGGEA